MTAQDAIWRVASSDLSDDEILAAALRKAPFDGFGAYETRPCPCPFCNNVITPRPPHVALAAGARMAR